MQVQAARSFTRVTVRLLLPVVFTLVLAVRTAPAAGDQARPADGFAVYLPVILRPCVMSGRMTDHGNGAGGVPLRLIFYNGNGRSQIGSTQTDANGDYSFSGLPSLSQFQFYTVDFVNASDPSRVRSWETRDISAADGPCASFGSVDLADATLTAPADGSGVSFPVTFQWLARPWVPGETYRFVLYDPSGAAFYEHSGPDGFRTLNSLPPGFSSSHAYSWHVYMLDYAPTLSFGITYGTFSVSFNP